MEGESQPKRLFQGTTTMLSTETAHLPELGSRCVFSSADCWSCCVICFYYDWIDEAYG